MTMQTSISPLKYFRLVFPSHRLVSCVDVLKYRFATEDMGKIYERFAKWVINRKGLPLTAELETWSSGGVIREIALVVKEIPENSFEDETPDREGLNGGW